MAGATRPADSPVAPAVPAAGSGPPESRRRPSHVLSFFATRPDEAATEATPGRGRLRPRAPGWQEVRGAPAAQVGPSTRRERPRSRTAPSLGISPAPEA